MAKRIAKAPMGSRYGAIFISILTALPVFHAIPGCSQKVEIALEDGVPSREIAVNRADGTSTGSTPGGFPVIKTLVLMPLLNRTDEPEAPVLVADALGEAIRRRGSFRLVLPAGVPDKIAPLFEIGLVGQLIAEVDDGGRASPNLARAITKEFHAEALIVSAVTLYQQVVDRFPDGKPGGEVPTTLIGAEITLVDGRTGFALRSASKIRRERGVFGFPSYAQTAKALADELVEVLLEAQERKLQ